jgi:hypothetical protein
MCSINSVLFTGDLDVMDGLICSFSKPADGTRVPARSIIIKQALGMPGEKQAARF